MRLISKLIKDGTILIETILLIQSINELIYTHIKQKFLVTGWEIIWEGENNRQTKL